MEGTAEWNRWHTSLVRTTPPFVGRHQQLDWLAHCLQDAIAGHPQVVLISGEAGIGKTRLLKELRSEALHRDVPTVYGRCYEDLSLPYLPFVETLLARLEQIPEELECILGTEVEVIRQFLGRHRSTLPMSSSSLTGQADQDKLRLLVAVARATITLAQRYPTLLVVDDLHWADSPSLDLFGHLVFTVADTAMREPVPLFILGTYRPEEREERLVRLTARLQREDICQTLELPGLDESEIQELIQGMGLKRPSHQLVATINKATQGNPLFVQEIVHHLRQQHALQERGGHIVTTYSPADLRLPEHVTGALVARTQRLGDGCRHLLTLAACLGDHFSIRLLCVVSGMSESEVLDLLDEGMHQHLLLSENQSFQFAHPLIRRAFYDDLNTVRLQRFHQQIAQTLERLYVNSLDAHILEIAHHLVVAGPAAEADKVVAYARWAGDQAFTVFAWSEAARYYEAALSTAEATGLLTAQDQADLHYRAGLAYHRDQDVGPCLDHYEKAIGAYRLTGDVQGLAWVLMEKTEIYYTLASVPYGTLADLQPLEEVLEVLGDREPGLRGRIFTIIAQAYRNARQPDRAKAIAQQALDIGQHLKDDHLCARASFALGLAHIQNLHMQEALESWQYALEAARQADDLLLQGFPLQRIPLGLILLGRFDEAEAVALEGCEVTRQIHDWGEYSLALSYQACVAVARGNFQAVERLAHETLFMVDRSGYPWSGARSLLALACARALCGAWSEAENALDRLVEPGRLFTDPGPYIVFAQAFRQLMRAHAGACNETIEPLVASLMQAVGTDTHSLAPLCALVELSDLMAAPAIAEPPFQALAMAVKRGILFSSGWIFLLPRVLGVAATLNGWWDKAESYFQMAIEAATHAGARPELGRTYLDYARMLAVRGGVNDHHRAMGFVIQAGSVFHDLGMIPFMQRAEQLREALQDRPLLAVLQPSSDLDNLSELEVEVYLRIAHEHINFLG